MITMTGDTTSRLAALFLLGAIALPPTGCSDCACDGGDAVGAGESIGDVSLADQVRSVREGLSTEIRLPRTRFAATDMDAVASLPALVRLQLSETDLTDADVARLAALPRLETLRLSAPAVTDKGLAALAASTSLRHLILLDAPVTDEGITQLKGMKQLESLYLTRTKVTDVGIELLKEHLPELHVHW